MCNIVSSITFNGYMYVYYIAGGFMKRAFTLAEVLITLGVIGIVAAMTLPALITSYEKKVTANKLKKFYTIMSQAIMLSEKDNEDLKYWMPTQDQVRKSEGLEEWYNMYLDKHIQSLNKKKLDNAYYQVTFIDGSGFSGYIASTSIIYIMYCTDFKYCKRERYDGRHSFLFTISASNKLIASMPAYQTSTRELLLDHCSKGTHDNPDASSVDRRHACTRLIQMDGWEIKPDYPWRQTIIVPEED